MPLAYLPWNLVGAVLTLLEWSGQLEIFFSDPEFDIGPYSLQLK